MIIFVWHLDNLEMYLPVLRCLRKGKPRWKISLHHISLIVFYARTISIIYFEIVIGQPYIFSIQNKHVSPPSISCYGKNIQFTKILGKIIKKYIYAIL